MFEVDVKKNVMEKEKKEEYQLRFFSWMVTPISTLQQSQIVKHHFGLKSDYYFLMIISFFIGKITRLM